MSIGYSANNVLGGPFDPGVVTQLNKRRDVVQKDTPRSDTDIHYLTGNTGWVRITSSINTYSAEKKAYTPDLSKKYQLFGGTSGANSGFNPGAENSSYSKSNEYGFIPTPGITSFQVKSQGTYGTLRTASFNFTVHSPEDFSILEQLYLRPGFTILLEWGHSLYLPNEDTSNGLETTVTPFPMDTFAGKLYFNEIESKIEDLRGGTSNKAGHSYNYDAMFGFIKNFTWSYNGVSYECQVDVVSKGELIESIKATMSPMNNFDSTQTDVEYTPTAFASELEGYLYAIKNAPPPISHYKEGTLPSAKVTNDSTLSYLTHRNEKLTKRLLDTYSKLNKELTFAVNHPFANSTVGDKYPMYITLRTFLMIINEVSTLYADGRPIVKFNVGEDTSKVSRFTTFYEHIGIDQSICILPKATAQDSNPFFFDISTSANIRKDDENDLLNILVNVDYLLGVVRRRKQAKLDQTNTIYDLVVDEVLLDISKNLGNINELDLHPNDDGSVLYVVDRSLIPPRTEITTHIDLVGLKSEITNLNITSKLPSNLTGMIAISAQNTYTRTSGQNLNNIQKWNEGLKNRHVRKVTIGNDDIVSTNEEEILTESKRYKIYLKYIEQINQLIKENNDSTIPDMSGLIDTHREVMNDFVYKHTSAQKTNPPGLIPFELTFTMKGIAGIKVGQSFKISEFFLPERYKGHVAFIVTGIDHTVSNNTWLTEVKSQMIFV